MDKSAKSLNKKRYRKEEGSENSDELFESEEEEEKPMKKNEKKSDKKKITKKIESDDEIDEDKDIIVGKDEVTFMLGFKKRLNVRKFKGQVLVDVREFWQNDKKDWLPGKKGISLNMEQWNKLKRFMDNIDEAIVNIK